MKTVLFTIAIGALVAAAECGSTQTTKKNSELKKDKRGTLKPTLENINLSTSNLANSAPYLESTPLSQSLSNAALQKLPYGVGSPSVNQNLASANLNFNLFSNPALSASGNEGISLATNSLQTQALNLLSSSGATNGAISNIGHEGISLANTVPASPLSQAELIHNLQSSVALQGQPIQVQQFSQIPIQQGVRTVVQHVPVPVVQPYPVTVTKHVAVPQPYPVHITKQVPVPVQVRVPVEVPRPYEVKVPHPVPVPVEVKVPVEIPKPYPVEIVKTIQVPVEKQVFIRVPHPVQVPVPQPYPVHVPQPVEVKVPYPIIVKEPQLVPVQQDADVQINSVSAQGSYAPAHGSYVPVQENYVPVQGNFVPVQGNFVPVQGSPVQLNVFNSEAAYASSGPSGLEVSHGSVSNSGRPVEVGSSQTVNLQGSKKSEKTELASLLPPAPPTPTPVNLGQSYVSSIQGGTYGLNKFNTADYQRTW